MRFRLGLWIVWIGAVGCGDTVQVNDTKKGLSGESCTSVNDCQKGLQCRDNLCVAAGALTADASTPSVRGNEGESCASRADCAAGLGCLNFVCVDATMLSDLVVSATRGMRGESCATRNDCSDGLSCIGETCIEADFMLATFSKECVRVECNLEADCCENYESSFDDVTCSGLQTDCNDVANLNRASSCTSYRNYCTCNRTCDEELCIAKASCTIDEECTILGASATCTGGACVGCTTDLECQNVDEMCIAGTCTVDAGCTAHEQCPRFEACQGGECVDVGCSSDRECYFATRDERSTCIEAVCVTPCETDIECGDFQICRGALCVFVGCDSDAECRTLLNLTNQSAASSVRAVCREPKE